MNETQPASLPEDDEISLLDLAIALGEEKRILFGLPIIVTLGAVIYALTLTPIYTAKATLALAQHYADILKSRTTQDALIEQFNLKQAYAVESPSEARKVLEGMTRIAVDKQASIIAIEVDDKDPAFAAKLANGYAQVLHHRIDEMETARIKQRREFYAGLIQRLQTHLDDTTEVGILSRARLFDLIRQKEAEYAGLRQSSPLADPIQNRRIRELSVLYAQFDTLEQALIPSNSVTPQDRHKIIMDILSYHYEQARLDEAREPTLLQMIDTATPPEQKSKPKRVQIVMLAGVAGFFLGILAAFIRCAWRRAGENPQSAGRMAELKRAWGIRSA